MSPSSQGHSSAPPDLLEHGAARDGHPQTLDRRLFVQLVSMRVPRRPGPAAVAAELALAFAAQPFGSVIYADLHDPLGLAVVAWAEDPANLAGPFRDVLSAPNGPELEFRTECGMLGRTYSTGYESDLVYWLIDRPKRSLLNPEWDYAIFYPLRRKGPFERLDGKEKGSIMAEHGGIGRAYGEHDLAHDIRLSCHGLDANDNDFVVGLLGKELYPLSHVVQAMRKTRQTADYMEKMGPFVVGRALHRTPGK
ncbi:MAG: chlorite dismutase family protein [Polyangiaceae bacterium]